MDELYAKSLEYMGDITPVGSGVLQPVKVIQDGFVYRHIETLHQALVQNQLGSCTPRRTFNDTRLCARTSMTTYTDELNEDVCFLTFSVIFNDHTSRHKDI
jgi:hypothetical protein